VRELLLRIPSWEAERIDDYVEFMQRFGPNRFTINILQNRQSVLNLDQWHNISNRQRYQQNQVGLPAQRRVP